MIPSGRFVAMAVLLLAGAAACDSSGGSLERQGRQQGPAETGVVIEVPKLDARKLGADTLDPAFRVFRERCQGCHDAPAPDSKPASLWDTTIDRMKKNVAEAGLMPWSATDEAAIRRFLDDHASNGS